MHKITYASSTGRHVLQYLKWHFGDGRTIGIYLESIYDAALARPWRPDGHDSVPHQCGFVQLNHLQGPRGMQDEAVFVDGRSRCSLHLDVFRGRWTIGNVT